MDARRRVTRSICICLMGTSFGWMNGTNIDNGSASPVVTSYDYDAPVSESGELTPKFYLFRNVDSRG